jgi:hypothetical protein
MYNYNQPSFSSQASPPLPVETRRGQYFNYVVPSGWRVVEDGQFAVVLFAPDNAALTGVAARKPLSFKRGRKRHAAEAWLMVSG